MRVRLRGINSVKKRLADGSVKVFYYAWKSGPPLRGELGSPEFIASYNEAVARKITPPQGVLLSLLQGYQASHDFLGRADRTRDDYVRQIKIIEAEFGDFPLSALTDRRTRGLFMAWRDRLAMKSRRQADYGWVVLARVLSWGMDRGLITANPCARGGRLYRGSRVDKIWTVDDEAMLFSGARPSTFTCHCCSHYGRDSGKATFCGFRGPHTMEGLFGCGNRKVKRASSSRSARHSERHLTPLLGLARSFSRARTKSRGQQAASARLGVRRVRQLVWSA